MLAFAALTFGAQAASARTAHLTVALRDKGRAVPRAFLGLSAEYNELDRYEATGADFVRLLDALRPPGDPARVILRVGGESADSTVWGPNSARWIPPAYSQGHPFQIDQAWMSRLAAVVRAARLKVMLDLNLAAHSPRMAQVVVSAARRTLPTGSLSDFEIGNEPDLYQVGLVGLTHTVPGGTNQWALSFEPNDYNAWFGNYVSAVRQVDPGAKFAGPEVESKSASWVRSLLDSSRSRDVSLVTVHTYPAYSACSGQGEPPPRAPRLPG